MRHHNRKYMAWAAPWRVSGSGRGLMGCGITPGERARALPHKPERSMLIHTGDALPTNQPMALTLRERKRLQLLAWRYRVQREARLRPMGQVLLERRPAGGQECPDLPACRSVRGHPSLPPGGPAPCSRHAGGVG